MNNTIKFCSGKNEEPEKEELSSIFEYIIIKAQPKRMISNINYIKCFIDEKTLREKKIFLQMESAKNFILNITNRQLNISEEEFDKNIEKFTMKKLRVS